jgi:hypothetical protein
MSSTQTTINDRVKNKIKQRIVAVTKDTKGWDKAYADLVEGINKQFTEICKKYDAAVEAKILDDLHELERKVGIIKKAQQSKR